MAHIRRLSSFSPTSSPTITANAALNALVLPQDSQEWRDLWSGIKVADIIDEPLNEIEETASVEKACEMLLAKNTSCLVITSAKSPLCNGLFDFADVNAFLTLAASQHTFTPDDLEANPRMKLVVDAAKAGRVPVSLVSNLSDKNPLITLPPSGTLLDILQIFSRGTHRIVIQDDPATTGSTTKPRIYGIISDRQTLSWFNKHGASLAPANVPNVMESLLTSPLASLGIITQDVVSLAADAQVLDAMRIMSGEGLSSVPVVDPLCGELRSVVSVYDIGKLVVPSQSKAILTTQLAEFVKLIKVPAGMQDGADKYPVYAVTSGSTLSYTIQMLLATNAHRVFVDDFAEGTPRSFGVTSIVDVLSRFAMLASIEPDTRSMQRRRRESSNSNASSRSQSSSSIGRTSRPNSSLLSSVSSLNSLSMAMAQDSKKM